MSTDLERLSINQATTRPQWSLAEAIEGYARAGIRSIGIWPDKLAECGLAEAKRRLAANDMAVSSLSLGRVFSEGASAGSEYDRCRRALDEAAELGADCVVVLAGTQGSGPGPGPVGGLARARATVRDDFADLLSRLGPPPVPLALEPIHPMQAGELSCVNTLDQALDLCDALGNGIGIAADLYHLWWDPGLDAALARAGDRILACQVSDWLVPTVDLMAGRGMPGDGVIDLPHLMSRIAATGYRRTIEIELMSRNDWWNRRPETVVAVCAERFLQYIRPAL